MDDSFFVVVIFYKCCWLKQIWSRLANKLTGVYRDASNMLFFPSPILNLDFLPKVSDGPPPLDIVPSSLNSLSTIYSFTQL